MPALKKTEKLMLAGIGVMVVVFIAMDPYYFIYRDPPEIATAVPVAGAKPGAPTAQTAKQPAAKPTKPGKGSKEEVDATEIVDNRPKREPVVFNNWGRDPFVQEKRSYDDVQVISGLTLNGISRKGEDSYALINKQIVRVGDAIEGLTVSRIEPDRVLLSKGGQTYVLMGGGR